MYSICVIGIVIASICVILSVLVQSPKSGMAANFGVANQVMGVRETTSFLEKFTWTLAVIILILSLLSTTIIKRQGVDGAADIKNDTKALQERVLETTAPMPQAEMVLPQEAPATEENND